MKQWQIVKLGDVLKYEQPTKYIVKSTNYSENYTTPVLTAGKSFLLGYTDEVEGVFNEYPVIIFDDFTTAIKYVDFPFKVKSSAMKILKAVDDVSNIRFLFYLMSTIKVDSEQHKRFWISKYSQLNIKLPPLETQKKIAAILDAADSYKQKTKALIDKYDALTQSLFLDMFGDPITNNKRLPIIKLGELGKWMSGGTPSRNTKEYFQGKIPWLSSGELQEMYISDSKEYITEEAIKESNTKLIEVGSLLLGMYDTAALKSSITKSNVTCNQAIAYCRLNDSIMNTIYVYTIIQIGKEHYRRLQRGVRQKNLNLSMVKNIEILYPRIELQNQFAERVQSIEAQKAQAQESLQHAENLFNSLLQKAFKGELVN